VWYLLFQRYGLPDLSPQPAGKVFCEWWLKINALVSRNMKRGLNSVIISGAWMLWRHLNGWVLNGASPSVQLVLSKF
jgi:hypothetical protein